MGLKKIERWEGVAERVLRGGFARRGIGQNPYTGEFVRVIRAHYRSMEPVDLADGQK